MGGVLGDFIHQLSIIKEIYDKTGRKGILYISNIARPSDSFRFGLEQAHKDTYEMVTLQEYIYSYHVHLGEQCDINLSSWALNQQLYVSNWEHIFQMNMELLGVVLLILHFLMKKNLRLIFLFHHLLQGLITILIIKHLFQN